MPRDHLDADQLKLPLSTPTMWEPCRVPTGAHSQGLVSDDGLVHIVWMVNGRGTAEECLAVLRERLSKFTTEARVSLREDFVEVTGNFAEYAGAFCLRIAHSHEAAKTLPAQLVAALHRHRTGGAA